MSEVALQPDPSLSRDGITPLAVVCLPKSVHFREVSDFAFTGAGVR